MFRFAFRPYARVACLGCAVALMYCGTAAPARAAWPLAAGGEVLLGYAATYTRDGRQTVHTGLDLAAQADEPILSPVAGTVSFAGRVPAAEGTMLAVTLQTDDGLLVTLMPLSTTGLTVGRAVGIGDSVGGLASGGDVSSGEPHLHVGVRRGERYLDPLAVLGSPPAATVADPPPGGGSIEPIPVPVEPPADEAAPVQTARAQVSADVVAPSAEVEMVQGISSELTEEPYQAVSAGDVQGSRIPASVNSGVTSRPAPAYVGKTVTTVGDSLPSRTQTFRDAHVEAIGAPPTALPSERTLAGGALLGAGLLALWPLWRGRRHLVSDVRPEINDVAAAVSR